MRATWTIAAVIAATSTAAAEPEAPRERVGCEVVFVRAPDDVRLVIERWLRGEPQCAGTIELRVVPTDDGLFLFAQRPDGRIHERLVPDADSAGVLVASWVADDWVASPPPAARAITAAPPSTLPAIETPAIAASAPHEPRARRWISLGGMLQSSAGGGGGVRAELDVLVHGAWALGLAASASASAVPFGGGYYLHTEDLKLAGYLAWSLRLGRWQLRPSIGVGVVHTSAEADMLDSSQSWSYVTASGTFMTSEASLQLSREIGQSWAIAAGPILTWHSQTLAPTDDVNAQIEREGLDLMLLGGLRRRI